MTDTISFIESFSDDDLLLIINCTKPSDLSNRFDKKNVSRLMSVIKQYKVKKPSNEIAGAILTTLNERLSSYPVSVLTTSTSLLTLSLSSLTALTGLAMGTIVLAGGVYFMEGYQQEKHLAEKSGLNRQFLHFKQQCVNELINRVSKKIDMNAPNVVELLAHHKGTHLKNLEKDSSDINWGCLQKFTTTSLVCSTMLFESYYLALQGILTVLGMTAIAAPMVSPIGLGLAAITCIGISLFLAAKQYQVSKENEYLKHYDKRLDHNITAEKELYLDLEKIAQPAKPAAQVDAVNQTDSVEIAQQTPEITLAPQKLHNSKSNYNRNDSSFFKKAEYHNTSLPEKGCNDVIPKSSNASP